MTTFTPHTNVGKWIGYQVLAGSGRGLALQSPVLAVQAHVSASQIAVGTAIVTWSQFLGGSIVVGLGQTAFSNLLRHALTHYAPSVDQDLVVEAGATKYAMDVPEEQRGNVLMAYNEAIAKTFFLAVGCAAAGVVSSVGLWRAKSAKPAAGKGKKEKGEGVEKGSETGSSEKVAEDV